MLRPTYLLATSIALAAAVAAVPANDVASFFLPEADSPSQKLVLEQLQVLGIDRYSPPGTQPGATVDTTQVWNQLATSHANVDLVWTAAEFSLPFEKLTFSTTFHPKVNHLPGSQLRLTADAFYKYIEQTQHQKEKFFFNYVPRYLVLPRDQAEMPKVFADTLKRNEFELKREDDFFIYQRFLVRELPASGNENALLPGSVIVNDVELQKKLRGELKGKSVEVTQYVEPYLIDGHKFQVGFYVVVTSIDPLRIYYYAHPQIKIAKAPYPAKVDFDTDRAAYNFNEYVAPWDFPDLQKLYYEMPSAARPGTNSWTVLKRYMMLQGLDTAQLQKDIDSAIVTSIISSRGFLQDQIKKVTGATTNGDAQTELDVGFFELFRFDMQLDDKGKPWLTRIHSNPSMAPEKSLFGTDEAIKKNLLFDLLNLVGVHPQAKPSFDEFFVAANTKLCADKCKDDSRTWDTTCWSCPGWFAPNVARRLFDSMNEYSRRGGFKLVFPSLEQDYSKFLDNTLSTHDVALNRYIKSLSSAYADKQDLPVFNKVVTCVYREHCSGNGDCINGKCVCDEEYEGASCYIPKDLAREKRLKEERAAAAARAKDSWVNKMWNRATVPAQVANARGDGANVPEALNAYNNAPASADQISGGNMFFGLLVIGIFMYGGYRVYVTYVASSDAYKDN